jgi:two-component system, OmpR family, sensor kinase
MSLRIRLTILYTLLLGSMLLLFSSLLYGLVSVAMINRVDQTLQTTTSDLINLLQVNSAGQFDPRSIANYQQTENLLIQVWGADHQLQLSRPTGFKDSLDRNAWSSDQIVFSNEILNDVQIRVMTTPLRSNRGSAGILQVGIDMTLVYLAQESMVRILLYVMSATLFVTLILIWIITGKVLTPLSSMTNVAIQIANADDLGRRVTYKGRNSDEIGKMASAFNRTLERIEKLVNSQQRFLADVSHELRTPLTAIKGNVGLIRKFGPDEESLNGIEVEVDRLNRLVGDLLLLNQAESGKIPFDMVKIELDNLIIDVVRQLQVVAGNKVKLKIDHVEPLVVNGDQDRLKQVFINLISNAIAYSQVKDTVNISLTGANDSAVFSLEDHGQGISEEDIPHIFERFYRGDKSRTRTPSSGFGLGLSIAKWITEKHTGRIEVKSELGKGTIFTVTLPLAKD